MVFVTSYGFGHLKDQEKGEKLTKCQSIETEPDLGEINDPGRENLCIPVASDGGVVTLPLSEDWNSVLVSVQASKSSAANDLEMLPCTEMSARIRGSGKVAVPSKETKFRLKAFVSLLFPQVQSSHLLVIMLVKERTARIWHLNLPCNYYF